MTPEESDDVIANLPRSRPSRRSPRRDAAQAKAATAHAKSEAAAAAEPAASANGTAKPKAGATAKPKTGPAKKPATKPKAAASKASARKPPIPPAGYAVPSEPSDGGSSSDVLSETLRAVGHLAEAGAGLLRGLVRRD